MCIILSGWGRLLLADFWGCCIGNYLHYGFKISMLLRYNLLQPIFFIIINNIGTLIGPYDIFYMVLDVTFKLTNLTEHGKCLYSAVT